MGTGRTWPNKVVHYTVCLEKGSEETPLQYQARLNATGCSEADVLELGIRLELFDAIARWNRRYQSHLKFNEVTKLDPKRTMVTFKRPENKRKCSSAKIGYQTTVKQHVVNIGSVCERRQGSMLHELLHVAGFYHEHQRRDRELYFSLTWPPVSNALAEDQAIAQHNWSDACAKYSRCEPKTRPYDFASIMQYRLINPLGPTLKFTDLGKELAAKVPKIGQRDDLSPDDVRALKELFP